MDDNSQGDKADCAGGVGTPSSASIRVVDKKDNVLFDGEVALGDSFTFGTPGEKLESVTFIYINGNEEKIEVHTSCSAPLILGERFGSVMLTSMFTDKNKTLPLNRVIQVLIINGPP